MHPRYLLTVLGACLLTLPGNSADYPWYTQGDFAPAQRLEFEVTNPTNLERPNTPVIIKYPFWRMTAKNPNATYACINQGQAVCPQEIERQSICIDTDIGDTLSVIAGKSY